MLNKGKILAVTAAAVLSGFVLSSSVIAHPDSQDKSAEMKHMKKKHRQHGHDMSGLRGLHKALSQLNLSDEQKSSLKTLKENNKDKMKAVKSLMKPLKKQMHQLLKADDMDENEIRNLSVQIAEHKAEHLILMASIKNQAIAILTDAQRAELKQLKQKRHERMKRHHENG